LLEGVQSEACYQEEEHYKCLQTAIIFQYYLDDFAEMREEHLDKNDHYLSVHDEDLPIVSVELVAVVEEAITSPHVQGFKIFPCFVN
jgi:hypothetical protein